MNYLLITLIFLFYLFFFIRAYTLSRSLGKSIKAKTRLLNFAILSATIASIIFIWNLIFPEHSKYLYLLHSSIALTIIGAILMTIGLIFSTIASLSLKKSWRIGIDQQSKTELITSGIYRISRNPYFLAYDMVLIGMILCVLSPFVIISALLTIFLFHILLLKEEKYLEKQHQDKYLEYKKYVRRYI